MKTQNKMRYIPFLLTPLLFIMLAAPALSMTSAQPTVNLGTTSHFAVLAGSTITNTGSTKINGNVGGDIGLYPGTAFPGQADVTLSGVVHLNDAAARNAKDDLVTAYNDAAGRTPVSRIPTELGGETLTPGTYDSASGTFRITGTLTLDAKGDPNGVFVFKTASTLITASGSRIKLINSARFCRTFWKVGSSATLGTNSHFVGHIFALTSITANTGASVQGQLLARNGAVTLDTNTITNGICANISEPTQTPIPTMTPASTAALTATATPTVTPTPSATPIAVTSTATPKPKATPAPTATPKAVTSTATSKHTTKPAPSATPIAVTSTATPKPKATPAPTPTLTPTINGGQLPKTATPWYNVLLIGAVLTLVGAVIWSNRKRIE